MILCCGEALIDFVPLPDGDGYKPCPGGSVYNIAVGLGRLKTPAGFFSKISQDFFGDLLLDYLRKNNVDSALCPRSADPTTLAFVSLPGEGEEPRFIFYANDSADRLLTKNELPSLPQQIKALHFGSISLVMEPGASALEALMRQESKRRIISLDPNVRPGLIVDGEAYRRRFQNWLEWVDIIKLSGADFAYLYPGETAETVIEGWLKKGPSLCILTAGAEGATSYTAAGARAFAPAPQVNVVDTVGAGDAFLAAALSYLARHNILYNRAALRGLTGSQLTDCLLFAVRAAAINCTRQGADPPWFGELAGVEKG